MSTQISLKLSDKMFNKNEKISGKQTYLASEKAIARNWLLKEEDEAWAHL